MVSDHFFLDFHIKLAIEVRHSISIVNLHIQDRLEMKGWTLLKIFTFFPALYAFDHPFHQTSTFGQTLR